MAKQRVGLYPGTFDPITLGHTDIIRRATRLVDRLVIAVAVNRDKGPMFPLEERLEMVTEEVEGMGDPEGCRIEVRPFENLLTDLADEVGAGFVIRGLRGVTDLDYEYQMVGMNARLNPGVETVFLTASHEYQFIASRLVREIARMQGDIGAFVPERVAARLRQMFNSGN